MFKLFSKKEDSRTIAPKPSVAVMERLLTSNVDVKRKTEKELIEEIHESFFTEVDRLLADAQVANSLETTQQELINKCKKLEALGFTQSKEVQEAKAEVERLHKLEVNNKEKEKLVKAINYFKKKYPFYKFITEDSVKKICAKYGLVYSTVYNYIGTIPDTNLEQMEKFQIQDEDVPVIQSTYDTNLRRRRLENMINKSIWKNGYEGKSRVSHPDGWHDFYIFPLEIAAPVKDFNIKNLELKDFELKATPPNEDPVVLQPVLYNGVKHYLIVTAWGLEASDPLVFNEITN